jgi:hypothetical protein
MALWNLAARDELAVQPASRHVADLLLAACNLYVDLTALQTAFMKQLRPFYTLPTSTKCRVTCKVTDRLRGRAGRE